MTKSFQLFLGEHPPKAWSSQLFADRPGVLVYVAALARARRWNRRVRRLGSLQ